MTENTRDVLERALFTKIGSPALFPGELGKKLAAELADTALSALADAGLAVGSRAVCPQCNGLGEDMSQPLIRDLHKSTYPRCRACQGRRWAITSVAE
jgi:hypothetical protein